MRLLLVEDEIQLSEALNQILSKNKYVVDAVYNGEDGLDYGLTDIYDVIVLDIMIPKLSGLEVLRRLRKENIKTPVLLLTAKGEIEDKVKGLDSGADDYLAKPFATEELLARLRALTRRQGEIINDNILEVGDIKLNISTYELEGPCNSIKLSLKEFEIIRCFMQRPRVIVTKDDLISKIWGYDSDAEYNNIEVYISFLRKKLGYVNSTTSITTVRGVGYKLEEV
ncbi:MAG: response regulator transcription factor [Clostridium celatum]|uniref:response regulator transcription factor n=1 Tax=Clostridium sp. TaxID=1506 RepID=UPI0025BFC6EC|nr:response regulator transcription factor [Clostridium sp.]MBS4956996.1 response regulator transcription factor [Clostridium sp.]MDU4882638.1 response regulator transcription factor [Clostridium celatum]MDU5261172.1 response regulator transcription factor [Clostridium celatum]MDU7077354.1 response regulator transcription factor [Clostridium celatum]